METKMLGCTEVAKIVREQLAKSYPGVKFSVKSKKYSGGSSIDVEYTDGPALKDVEKLIGHYEGARMNAMEDLKEYRNTTHNGEQVQCCNDFLFIHRSYSDAVKEAEVNWYLGYYGDYTDVKFVPAHNDGRFQYEGQIVTGHVFSDRRLSEKMSATTYGA